MKREPSLATLKALAEALAANVRGPGPWDAVSKALHAYEAEIAPRLRTRAEVDAEIAQTCRSVLCGPYHATALCSTLARLCAEPTAPVRVVGPFTCTKCGRANEDHRHQCRSCGAAR